MSILIKNLQTNGLLKRNHSMTFACILLLVLIATISRCDSNKDLDTNKEIATTDLVVDEPAAEPTDISATKVDSIATTTTTTTIQSETVAGADSTINSNDSTPSDSQQKTASTTTPAPKKEPLQCMDDNYCLNGGTCVLTESGQMLCLCPEGFYGARCQTRNICKTIIADSLTGDQICLKINRECVKNDKFFRCSCHEDEYFIFRAGNSKNQQQDDGLPKASAPPEEDSGGKEATGKRQTYTDHIVSSANSLFPGLKTNGDLFDSVGPPPANYLAECRKIDKCLGVRCKQMSEVCLDGKCVCNQPLGYILDPTDGLCKLLNPCLMAQPDGMPICGQAQCYPTYDEELYNCVCPIGHTKIRTGASKSSTQCALMTDTVCSVPLLNKCQHICQVAKWFPDYQNSYVCSCLPGYKPGTQVGVDDHMCFFDEPSDQSSYNDPNGRERASKPSFSTPTTRDYVYRSYLVPKQSAQQDGYLDSTFTYDPIAHPKSDETSIPTPLATEREQDDHLETDKTPKFYETIIKREARLVSGREATADNDIFGGASISKMSAQDRCNVFCEENKICVLEKGSTDSYKCVCDRQGYLSVGDRCLDWCSAAEFSYKVQAVLEVICLSGACNKVGSKPSAMNNSRAINKLDRESSWRPTFECDCRSSIKGLLVQDEDTKLCKINYQAIIDPCKPGNVGYVDCVENKNAFCAVLHKPSWAFMRDLRQSVRPETPSSHAGKTAEGLSKGTTSGGNTKKGVFENSYICVCSPDKKFLVDKPRNKERCVDECDLLSVECGRFNRMCRAATITPDDFNRLNNLVRIDPDGARLNFKRTGCECLPGFNVGPSESVDFTLDDNINPSVINIQPPGGPTTSHANLVYELEGQTDSEHFRAKYMNINSRCLLDYDVVEFHASFKAPHDFDPNWIKISNASPTGSKKIVQQLDKNNDDMKSAKSTTDHNGSNQNGSPPGNSNAPGSDNSCDDSQGDCMILKPPDFMRYDISELHKHVVLVAQCEPLLLSIEAFQECTKYRYWIMMKLRNHFVDWRRVLTTHLKETFDLMDGDIRLRVNKCEATLKTVSTITTNISSSSSSSKPQVVTTYFPPIEKDQNKRQPSSSDPRFNPEDHNSIIDADISCELTLHSASDYTSLPYTRKVLLEKQLQKFIFVKPTRQFGDNYYLMAPNMLIQRESFDQLANHRKLFNPCNSDYEYCDKQTKCEMVDTVNFTCTCEYGYTPIGSRDIYFEDSRKEVCEDINECLFDVCKELADVATCINEVGDYRCQCNRHYTGDNKRYCRHVCFTIPCKQGKCRLVDDHHAFCECDEGYKEADCSVQDPNVALRKANMIICGSIFTSVLLLAITFAISLNSQLKKTKKKLKRYEAINDMAHLFEFNHQQPFRQRMSKVSVCS